VINFLLAFNSEETGVPEEELDSIQNELRHRAETKVQKIIRFLVTKISDCYPVICQPKAY